VLFIGTQFSILYIVKQTVQSDAMCASLSLSREDMIELANRCIKG
jgi:hypothetical protein